MVHVTSEAKARPIITALTRTSAERNIDQGDSSRSAGAVDFSDLLPPSAGVAVASEAAGAEADGTTGDDAGACTGGAACAGIADGCGCDSTGACGDAGTVFCCADDGDASDSIASAKITP
jgi:hypothetical protein